MAAPQQEFEGMTDEDRRHLDFMQLLIRISDALSKKETADVKLYCMYLIPKARIEKLKRPVEVFVKLKELGKIDQENLDFVEELLERMGRQDLIQDVLRPAQQHDREVPENPELQPPDREVPENTEDQPEIPEPQPGTSQEETPDPTSNIYTVVHGHSSMTQETVDRHRQNIASACNTRRSQVKFRGYKKHKSILVHLSIPRKNTAVLRHMADHSDPRLVYMGVKSLQIDAEVPIKVQQEPLFYDVKRQLPVDDIEVGCSTRTKHQRAPQCWTRLSALNLFSDALPLHLQAAASLEYQGFSYSLVRALVQKDRLREHQMRQAIQNLKNAEVDSNTLRQKAEVDSNTLRQKAEADSNTLRQKAEVDSNTLRQKAEVDSNTLRQTAEVDSNTLRQKADVDSNTVMTLRSKLDITENRLKEALETIAVLEEKLQQAQEYTEKAVKQVASHVTEYRGEKPPGGWPQEYRGEKPPGDWSQGYRGEKPPGGWPQEYRGEKPPGGWPKEYRGEKPPGGWSAQVEKADAATRTHLAGPVGTTGGDMGSKLGKERIVEEEDTETAGQDSDIGGDRRDASEQERHTLGTEGATSSPSGDSRKQRVITFGRTGSDPGEFQYPRGVVVSPNNDIFVADYGNSRVQVYGTEGVYLRHFPTVVPGTKDKDMRPHDVCMDGNGTLWVVGRGWSADHVVQYSTHGTAMARFDLRNLRNHHLRGIAINKGILVTEAEQGAVQVFRPDGSLVRTVRHPEGGMRRPGDVTVDGEGNILVSDWYNNYVYVYDEFGKFLFQFGGKGSGEGQLKYPLGICTDSSGHILVADSGNKRVQIFTRHGEFVRTVSIGSEPACLAMGPEGQLVVSNGLSHTVTVFSRDDPTDEAKKDARERYDSRSDRRQDVFGINAPEQERQAAGIEGAPSGSIGDKEQGLVTFGGEETQPGEYWYPRGVVVSPSNEIFVTDHNNRRVQVHSTEGVYLRHFPTVVPGTGDNTIQPRDVCMDGNGTLWVVGEGGSADHVVQYSTNGTAMARFDLKKSHHFRGIAVNVRTSHVLITDADQGEVLVFRPDGSLVRTVRYSLAGEIKRPRYITVDGEGNILVSDYNSNSVYVYDESGKFPFQFGGLGSGEGQLNGPRGICTNRLGHIIVADSRNKRVQIFTRHGEYVRTDSTGFEPEYLAVGPEGQLVVTSRVDRTVTVFPNY
ncbi:uncharacterized protein LOC144867305 isoform X2 [Branchiostoma floridae x Branchiostoma japonicum]